MNTRVIALVVTLVLGAGAGGWLLYLAFAPDPAPGPANGAADGAAAAGAPTYLSLDPPFLVNFEVQGTLRFLQASISVMSRSDDVISAIEEHMPYVRNNVLLVLSNQTLDTIATLEAKQKLRDNLRSEVSAVLRSVGAPDGVDAVYFTSFVMQ